MEDSEQKLENAERARILAAPIPPLTAVRIEELVEEALAILADNKYPWDKPGLRPKLTRIVKVGLRVTTRIEFDQPPEVFGTWDNYLQSSELLTEFREYHVEKFEFSRRVAADRVGRLPVLCFHAGD